ncbi:hypothetical protein ZWY2020_022987 [Hordeum vulgare]|nr:hypothetical protein ZWY2020_022987 [Hordeum vulgare]
MATPLSPADFPSFLTDPASSPAYLYLLLKQCEGLEVADHSLINSFDELQPKEAEYLSFGRQVRLAISGSVIFGSSSTVASSHFKM